MKDESIPSIDQLCETDLAELKSSGLTIQQISQLGHFTVVEPKLAKKYLGFKHTGLVFSYFNPISGQPFLTSKGRPYYRIKPRYKENPLQTSLPKYLSPCGEGNKPYWSRLIKDFDSFAQKTSVPLHIVEGEKKSDSLAAEGFFVLGLSGVWGWLDKTTRLEEIDLPPAQLIEDDHDAQKELKEKKLEQSRLLPEIVESLHWQHRQVYISFDSDLWEKSGVGMAARQLAGALTELGARVRFVILPSEINGDKNGVDDFKVRHGIEAYDKLSQLALPKLDKKDPFPLYKIMLCWSVLKESWRFRAGMGWYFWQGDCWSCRSDCEFESSLIEFFDQQQWLGTKGLDTLIRQLRSRLLVNEKFWNPKHKLTFSNGTKDLNTNQFGPHRRDDFITQVLPYEYDPAAVCPQWQKFLLSAVGGDTEAVELLRAFMKWILLPKDRSKKYPIEKSLDLLGPKGSGKGTFLDALINVVGADSTGTFDSGSFQNPNSLTQLLDKKIAVDADSFGGISNVGQFNKIVSNEPVLVKKLYKDVANTRLGTVIVRAYNRVPEVPDGSEGLDRRVIVVSFSHRPQNLDLDLPQKLSLEAPGIFQWAWSMTFEEAKERLHRAGEVPSVSVASTKRFEINNPEYVFLQEVFPKGNRVRVTDFYASYLDWCKENGLRAKKRRKLMEAVLAFGVTSNQSTGGFYFASVPPMRDFNLIAHLGITKNLGEFQKSFTPRKSTYSTCPDTAWLSEDLETQLSKESQLSLTQLSGVSPPPDTPKPTVDTQLSLPQPSEAPPPPKTPNSTVDTQLSLPQPSEAPPPPKTPNSTVDTQPSLTQPSEAPPPPKTPNSTVDTQLEIESQLTQTPATEPVEGQQLTKLTKSEPNFFKQDQPKSSEIPPPQQQTLPGYNEAPPEAPYQLGTQYLVRQFADTSPQDAYVEWVRATLVGFEDPPLYTKFTFQLADGSRIRKYHDDIEELLDEEIDPSKLSINTRLLIEDQLGRFLCYEVVGSQANQFFRLKCYGSEKLSGTRLWSLRELVSGHAVLQKPEEDTPDCSFSPGDYATFSQSQIPTNGVVQILKLLDGFKALCLGVNDRYITLKLSCLKSTSGRYFNAEREHYQELFGGRGEPGFS